MVGASFSTARQCQPDEERADRTGDLQPLGHPGHEQRDAEHGEQERLVGATGDHTAHPPAVPECGEQDHRDGGQCDQHARDGCAEAAAHDQGRHHRQVDRHGKVLDHEDVQHRRGLAVAEATQVGQHLADHARRADPGDATEQHRSDRVPPEQEPERDTGQCVQRHVDRTGPQSGTQTAAKFGVGVFEAEREQQQQHTDLGGDLEELDRHVELHQTAFAHCEPGDQVQRDRGDAEATGDP